MVGVAYSAARLDAAVHSGGKSAAPAIVPVVISIDPRVDFEANATLMCFWNASDATLRCGDLERYLLRALAEP